MLKAIEKLIIKKKMSTDTLFLALHIYGLKFFLKREKYLLQKNLGVFELNDACLLTKMLLKIGDHLKKLKNSPKPEKHRPIRKNEIIMIMINLRH